LEIVYNGVFLSGFSFSPFMVLSAHRTFKPVRNVENNRIRGEIAHSKTQRSHKYVNNAWRELQLSSNLALYSLPCTTTLTNHMG
jgi:hypothetical protein